MSCVAGQERDDAPTAMNPFRNLMETWLLQEMMFHHEDNGQLVQLIATTEDFTTKTAKSVYRSILIGEGDFRKTIHSILEDYPDIVKQTFFARLAIMKKTPKDDSRDDWLSDLDLSDFFEVLRRNDDLEIIDYCVRSGLYREEAERGMNGHLGEVRGIRS